MAVGQQLVCPACGREEPDLSFRSECPKCGALLDLRTEWNPVAGLSVSPAGDVANRAAELRARFDQRLLQKLSVEPSGVWRYRELVLPLLSPREIVSFPEGDTPVLASERLRRWSGARHLQLKHEGLNPTGSFKDRGMTVAISHAMELGARAVACASTGNTSASMAAYASRAGLRSIVLIPAGKIASGKLAQTTAHGAQVVAVRGSFDDCLALLREAGEQLGVYIVNSVNPFRLAGQRTIVYELLHQLDWNPPDWLVLPAGNLGNTSAFGAALLEAKRIGLIGRMPRLVAVQAAGAAPFATAFADGFKQRIVVEPETVATAIRIGAPASWDRAVHAIRETRGVVMSVSDDAIMDAKREIDAAGIGCEPASAATVAGIRQLVADGTIHPTERVVGVLTGHLMKDAASVVGPTPVEIDPTIEQLTQAVA
jgi:threonine synthase